MLRSHAVTHAAVVAIRNAYKKKEDVAGSTLYVTMYPASRDGVEIVEAELKEMVYMHEMREENRKRYNTGATKRLLDYDVVTRYSKTFVTVLIRHVYLVLSLSTGR